MRTYICDKCGGGAEKDIDGDCLCVVKFFKRRKTSRSKGEGFDLEVCVKCFKELLTKKH